jgi:hypothetical protein
MLRPANVSKMSAKHGQAPGRLTGGLLQALRLNGSDGGRGWDRTSDLSDVNRAL